jgi:hypothetical protein
VFFTVKMPSGADLTFMMKDNQRFKKLYREIAKTRGIRLDDFDVTFEGQLVLYDATPLSIDLENDAQMKFRAGHLLTSLSPFTQATLRH